MTYLPLKFLLTLLSVVLPIPAGLFTPTFVIGGIFGRLVGEAIKAYDLLDTPVRAVRVRGHWRRRVLVKASRSHSTGRDHHGDLHTSDGLNLPVSIAILASYFHGQALHRECL
ncbi:hypothetical protein PINS_up023012 [Pythium insidiosum]|nr:hypothetical protein PINS_up023012 [Pythium insidiosum]